MRLVLALVLLTASLGTQKEDKQEEKANIDEACKAVRMDCSFSSRNDLIDTVYHATGIVMFDWLSSPYATTWHTPLPHEPPPRYYVMSAPQNEKLARNILANKHLFERNGTLTFNKAKRWRRTD